MSKVYREKAPCLSYGRLARWTELWSDDTGSLFEYVLAPSHKPIKVWWNIQSIEEKLEEVKPLRRFENYVYLWVDNAQPELIHSSFYFDSEEKAKLGSMSIRNGTTCVAIVPVIWEEKEND